MTVDSDPIPPVAVPRAARLLGLAGILPTAFATLMVWVGPRDIAAVAVSTGAIYGAVILSFIGGAWWGLAAARADTDNLPRLLALSVVPSLTAWLALIILSPGAVAVIGLSFAGALAIDRRLVIDGVAPDWWWRLRFPLSTTMAVLHGLLAIGMALRGY